jgi:hypothetical protein
MEDVMALDSKITKFVVSFDVNRWVVIACCEDGIDFELGAYYDFGAWKKDPVFLRSRTDQPIKLDDIAQQVFRNKVRRGEIVLDQYYQI